MLTTRLMPLFWKCYNVLLEDLRWVREASTSLRTLPDQNHHPEPWMKLLENHQMHQAEETRMCEVHERRAADKSAGVCVHVVSR